MWILLQGTRMTIRLDSLEESEALKMCWVARETTRMKKFGKQELEAHTVYAKIQEVLRQLRPDAEPLEQWKRVTIMSFMTHRIWADNVFQMTKMM
ncbi:hypothetical protein Tco_0559989 [Tanacetum coccineum]